MAGLCKERSSHAVHLRQLFIIEAKTYSKKYPRWKSELGINKSFWKIRWCTRHTCISINVLADLLLIGNLNASKIDKTISTQENLGVQQHPAWYTVLFCSELRRFLSLLLKYIFVFRGSVRSECLFLHKTLQTINFLATYSVGCNAHPEYFDVGKVGCSVRNYV